jgi:hypothetical protein
MTNSTDVCHLLSYSISRDYNSLPSQVVIDGSTNTLLYCDHALSIHKIMQRPCGSIVDGEANGGHSGSGVVLLEIFLTFNVSGLADKTLQKVSVCTVAGLFQTQFCPISDEFHQYAHCGTGKTIHSVSQLRQFGTIVDNTPFSFADKKRLKL